MPNSLSTEQADSILNKLAEISQEVNPQHGMTKKAGLSVDDKERLVTALLNDSTGRGFKRLAYAMTEPV